MRRALALVVVVAGCGRSEPSGTGSAARPAPTPTAPAPTAPPPSTPPSAEPPPNVDCGRLVTIEDITAVCGAGYEVKAETNPVAVQHSACALKLTLAGKDDRQASVTLLDKHDATEADNWTKLQYADGTPIAGLGDRAWSKVTDHPDRHSTDYDVGVVKGRLVLTFASTKNELIPRSPCTVEQFADVARRVIGRVP